MYFAARRLATALASRAFAELPQSGAPIRSALIELLQITILLVAAVPLLAIVQPFMEPVEGIGIIVVTILLMIVVVTRSARQMQGQIRNATRIIRLALSGAHAAADGTQSYDGARFIRSPRHRHDHADKICAPTAKASARNCPSWTSTPTAERWWWPSGAAIPK